MNCILIDAFSLACPAKQDFERPDEYKAAFIAYLQSLVSWQSARNDQCFVLLSNNDIAPALSDTNAYPFWGTVTNAIAELALAEEFQARDIIELCNALLTKTPTLEAIIGVVEILCEDAVVLPVDAVEIRPKRYVSHLERLIGLVAVDVLLNKRLNGQKFLASYARGGINQTISVDAMIHALDGLNDAAEKLQFPLTISQSLEALISYPALLSKVQLVELWKQKCEYSCRAAIEASLVQVHSATSEDVAAIRNTWRFGDQFLISLARLDCFSDETRIRKIIRACCETILRKELRAIHPLRIGSGANTPQKTRRDFVAQRRDVDHVFHLHFWDDQQSVELANLVTHNDFDISH